MTQAQWTASIEAVGVLTSALAAGHCDQALSDGDAANAATIATGNIPAATFSSRDQLLSMRSFYLTSAIALGNPLLTATARTQLVNAGTSYYNTSGAP